MKKEERIHYFDVAKGVFILLLLLHHLKDSSNIYGVDMVYFKLTSQWQSIYTAFFMQAFFFVSGYCSSFNRPFKDFILLNVKILIFPLVTFVLFNALIEILFFHDSTMILNCCSCRFWLIGSPFWFLSALFLSKLCIYILVRYIKHEYTNIVITLILIPFGAYFNKEYPGYNLLCVYHAMLSVFFVYLGFIIKKHQQVYNCLLRYSLFVYPILIFLIKIFHHDIPSVTAGLWLKWYETPLFLVTSLSGIFASLRICKIINSNSFLEYFGRNSLIVYGCHYTMLGIISYYFYNFLFVPNSWLEGTLFIMLVITIAIIYCYMVINLFRLKYIRKVVGK